MRKTPNHYHPTSYWAMPGIATHDLAIGIICKYYDLDRTDILGKCRKRELVEARQVIAYVARYFLYDKRVVDGRIIKQRPSLLSIGMLFNPIKDHATIHHSCREVDTHYETDKAFRDKFDDITKLLAAKGIVRVEAVNRKNKNTPTYDE